MHVSANVASTVVVLTSTGRKRSIHPGDRFRASDDVVREFPHLFDRPVETATAVPGERR